MDEGGNTLYCARCWADYAEQFGTTHHDTSEVLGISQTSSGHGTAPDSSFIHIWLHSIDDSYVEYASMLIEAGYDSKDTLANLEIRDLVDMGVKMGHAKLIMSRLQNKKRAASRSPQTSPTPSLPHTYLEHQPKPDS